MTHSFLFLQSKQTPGPLRAEERGRGWWEGGGGEGGGGGGEGTSMSQHMRILVTWYVFGLFLCIFAQGCYNFKQIFKRYFCREVAAFSPINLVFSTLKNQFQAHYGGQKWQ